MTVDVCWINRVEKLVNRIGGVVLASVGGPSLAENEPAVEISGLRGLLDPDSFKDVSLPVSEFCLQDFCYISVRSVFHVPCVYYIAVLPVVCFDRILVLFHFFDSIYPTSYVNSHHHYLLPCTVQLCHC